MSASEYNNPLATNVILPKYTTFLKDGKTEATVYPVYRADEVPQSLLEFMCREFNSEIERGDTYPYSKTLDVETFKQYWLGKFTAIMLLGNADQIPEEADWEKVFLGTFYIKPNYPGRCAHVCNAGFVVNHRIRGQGIGGILGGLYVKWAGKLGYTYSVYNLVFETNKASLKIWDNLGFERIGRIKGAGRLKGYDKPVDAIMFGKDLES